MAGKRKSVANTATIPGDGSCAPTTTSSDASGSNGRRASKRLNLDYTHIDAQKESPSLGCPKCRFGAGGCSKCRSFIAAAAAAAEGVEPASNPVAAKKVQPTAKPVPAPQSDAAPAVEARTRRSQSKATESPPKARTRRSQSKATAAKTSVKEPEVAAAPQPASAPSASGRRRSQVAPPAVQTTVVEPASSSRVTRKVQEQAQAQTKPAPTTEPEPARTRRSLSKQATKSPLKVNKSPMKIKSPPKQPSSSSAKVLTSPKVTSPPQSKGPSPESARKHRTQTSMAQDTLVNSSPVAAVTKAAVTKAAATKVTVTKVHVTVSAPAAAVVLPVVAEPAQQPEAVASVPLPTAPTPPAAPAAVTEVELSAPSAPSPSSAALMLQEREREAERLQSECNDITWWDPLDPAKASQAKGALHVSAATAPGQLPLCRERQVEAIDAWLQARLTSAQGGSMYLSGLPGTGKSLTAMELARRCVRHSDAPNSLCKLAPAIMGINCMRLTEPRQVVERILAGYRTACRRSSTRLSGAAGTDSDPMILVPDEEDAFERRASAADAADDAWSALRRIAMAQPSGGGKGGSSAAAAAPATGAAARRASAGRKSLGGSVSSERGMIVVVLDEIDGLLSGRHGDQLVGELFALAKCPGSRLVLIGIANSIDLVQQLLRPGGAFHRHNLRPAHEMFPAYMRIQVSKLITLRLASLPGPVFEPSAIEFCARKISNGNGDMRRALEAASQAIDILVADEQEKRKKQQQQAEIQHPADNQQGEGSEAVPSAAPTAAPKKVGMRQMAAALSKVTGGIGASNDNVSAIKNLPVPQQLIMCTLGKLLGDKLAGRGLIVKAPGGPRGTATAAARFIGNSGLVSEPLLLAPEPSKSLADSHRRRSSTGGNAVRKAKDLTLAELEGAHSALCKRVGVEAYSAMEFATATDMLCTLGLMELAGSGGDRKKHRVMLRVAEDDVLMALADVPVLKNVVGA